MMRRLEGNVLLVLTIFVSLGLIAFILGCSLDEMPLSPKKEADHPQWLRYDPTGGGTVAKPLPGEEYPYVEKLIKAGKGGKLILGDLKTLKATLEIDDDALSEDTVIGMGLPEPGKLVFDFDPDGLVFMEAVKLTVESNTIELDDSGSVTLWYYHEDTGEWEEIDTEVSVKVNGKTVVIEAELEHFSRYAFAGSDYNSVYYGIDY